MLLGFWAARRRVLEEPHNHLRMLRWTAVVGLAIGWLGGLPAALAHIGVLEVPAAAVSEEGALRLLADGTGLAGGLGLGALLGSAAMAAFAVGVWLVTVVGASAMDRAGWRGPAEVLLRRLTYRTAGRPERLLTLGRGPGRARTWTRH